MTAASILDPASTNTPPRHTRRWPIGAEVLPDGTTHFRVWAPRRKSLAVALENAPSVALENEGNGYHSGVVAAPAGTRYRLQIDNRGAFPDPASRFQPDGPHGPSEIIDSATFAWTDHDWRGVAPQGRVLYEMHIGTFTKEGTWEAAAREQLPRNWPPWVSTLVEVMPIADFPGRFGWGYDGVESLCADAPVWHVRMIFGAFVDSAHERRASA